MRSSCPSRCAWNLCFRLKGNIFVWSEIFWVEVKWAKVFSTFSFISSSHLRRATFAQTCQSFISQHFTSHPPSSSSKVTQTDFTISAKEPFPRTIDTRPFLHISTFSHEYSLTTNQTKTLHSSVKWIFGWFMMPPLPKFINVWEQKVNIANIFSKHIGAETYLTSLKGRWLSAWNYEYLGRASKYCTNIPPTSRCHACPMPSAEAWCPCESHSRGEAGGREALTHFRNFLEMQTLISD